MATPTREECEKKGRCDKCRAMDCPIKDGRCEKRILACRGTNEEPCLECEHQCPLSMKSFLGK